MGQDILKLWPIEAGFIKCLSQIERRGIRVNLNLCDELHEQSQHRMATLTDELGFKPSELSSLARFILDELKLPVVAWTDGGKSGNKKPSFNKHAMEEYDVMLEAVQNESARKVLEFRGWQKADSACYVAYRKLVSPDGRIRPSFKVHGTVTGRLSCQKPNLQQIPRKTEKPWNGKVKQCFIPENDDWELWGFDYKTLEFRLAALYANEKQLIEAINEGRDVHQVTADQIGIERHDAKTLNFAILYGAGPVKIKWMLGKSEDETNEILNRFHSEFPGFRNIMRAASSKANKQGFVTYWSGRKKHYNTRWNKDEHHKAFNALCQGGGAEIVKQAMVRCMPVEIENQRRMVLQVHDEVLWEIRKDMVEQTIMEVSKIMSDYDFPVKFDVEAKRWE